MKQLFLGMFIIATHGANRTLSGYMYTLLKSNFYYLTTATYKKKVSQVNKLPGFSLFYEKEMIKEYYSQYSGIRKTFAY